MYLLGETARQKVGSIERFWGEETCICRSFLFSKNKVSFYKGRHKTRMCKVLIKEECKQHSFVRMETLQKVVEGWWDGGVEFSKWSWMPGWVMRHKRSGGKKGQDFNTYGKDYGWNVYVLVLLFVAAWTVSIFWVYQWSQSIKEL